MSNNINNVISGILAGKGDRKPEELEAHLNFAREVVDANRPDKKM